MTTRTSLALWLSAIGLFAGCDVDDRRAHAGDTRRTSGEPVPPKAVDVAARLDVTGVPTYP